MKQRGPWKIKSSEVKYKNPWIEVREDQVIRPDGKDGVYATFKVKDGAQILALDDEMNVYLTEEFHYGYGEVTIEVVAGGTEKGEDILEGAKRELLEELGIIAQEWIDLGNIAPLTTYTRQVDRAYLARTLSFTKGKQDPDETIKIIKVPFKTAIEMVMGGQIVSAESCAVILKAAKYLGKVTGTSS